MTEGYDNQNLVPWQPDAKPAMMRVVDEAVALMPTLAPSNFNTEGFFNAVSMQFANEPKLYDAKPQTVVKALNRCVSLGLCMGDECNLVPFYDKQAKDYDATLMIEFHAWLRRFAEIPGYQWCKTGVVREQDDFEWDDLEGTISHKPNRKARSAPLEFAYCVLQFENGQRWFEVLDREDIARHKKHARDGGASGPWQTDTKEMWRKSAIHAFAARYRSAIPGAGAMLAIESERSQIEYQRTPGDQAAYEQAVSDLYGDRSSPSMYETVETDETVVTVSESEDTDWSHHLLRIKGLLNELGIDTVPKLKRLMGQCDIDPKTDYMSIKDHALLDRLVTVARQNVADASGKSPDATVDDDNPALI